MKFPPPAYIPTRSSKADPSQAATATPVTYEVIKDLGQPADTRLRALAADRLPPQLRPPETSIVSRLAAALPGQRASGPSERARMLRSLHRVVTGEFHPRGAGAALVDVKGAKSFSPEYLKWFKDGKSADESTEFIQQVIETSARVLAHNEEVSRGAAEAAAQTARLEPGMTLVGKDLYRCAYGLMNQQLDQIIPPLGEDGTPSPYVLVPPGTSIPELRPEVRSMLLTDFYDLLDRSAGEEGRLTVQALGQMVARICGAAQAAMATGRLKVPGMTDS